MRKILVTGASGQIGTELVPKLRSIYGNDNVVATDIKDNISEILKEGPYEKLDVLSKDDIVSLIKKYNIDTIYHLAAILSAMGEKNPQLAYNVNFGGFYNILEIGRELKLKQIMVPSSIAVFGPDTPKDNTPNDTILRPTTMYGVSKVAGELLGNYYFYKYGLDVRGVRYPGIISSEAPPGGGTTDYAVEIFHEAIKNKYYSIFLKSDTMLPMMYMPDALKALIDLSEAPLDKLKHHCDYNVAAMSFTPEEIANEIKKYIPDFKWDYNPDYRQDIADSWPNSIDDTCAREEWGWKPDYDMKTMTEDMIKRLKEKYGE